jgi:hypothetical protein
MFDELSVGNEPTANEVTWRPVSCVTSYWSASEPESEQIGAPGAQPPRFGPPPKLDALNATPTTYARDGCAVVVSGATVVVVEVASVVVVVVVVVVVWGAVVDVAVADVVVAVVVDVASGGDALVVDVVSDGAVVVVTGAMVLVDELDDVVPPGSATSGSVPARSAGCGGGAAGPFAVGGRSGNAGLVTPGGAGGDTGATTEAARSDSAPADSSATSAPAQPDNAVASTSDSTTPRDRRCRTPRRPVTDLPACMTHAPFRAARTTRRRFTPA